MSHTKQDPVAEKRARKTWGKPRLERLGTIADIAGTPPPFLQANQNKHS